VKKIVIVFLLIYFKSNAQDFSVIEKNRFETTEDYKKAEPEILKLADYLLRTPTKPHLKIDNSFAIKSNRGRAFIYMDYWLSGPKEELIDGTSFKFIITGKLIRITKGDGELFAMFMASLAKALISYPKLSKKKIYKKAYETLAKYCADEKNNLKPSKTLKKLMESMEKT